MFLLLLACAGPDTPDPDDTAADTAADPDDTAADPDDTAVDTAGDTGDTGADTGDTGLPTDLVTFEVCGVPVAIVGPVVAEGFSAFDLPDQVPRTVRWSAEHAYSVDGHALVRRDTDLAELDRVDLLPYPVRVDLAGSHAFVTSGTGGLSVIDVSGAPEPEAWWAPARDESGPRMAGVSHGRLVLADDAGFSLVDVSVPAAPVELSCTRFPTTDYAWMTPVSEDFLAAAMLEGVAVYDLATDTPTLLGVVPVAEEGAAVLHEDRLLVWEDHRTVVLYQLTPGAPPVEVGRRTNDTRVQNVAWEPAVAGGFALHGGLDDAAWWAIDLTDDAMPLYSTFAEEGGAYDCVTRYTAATDGTAWELAPLWAPDGRHAPDTLALDCPAGEHASDHPTAGVREPGEGHGGDRVLYRDDAWRTVDLFTGAEVLVTSRYADQGAWLGDGFGFAYTEGSDWSIPLVSTITRTDAAGAVVDVVPSPGPFVALAPLDREFWVLSEPVGRDYGDAEPPVTDRLLWRLGGTGDRVPVALPEGAAPVDLASGGGRAWVFDAAGAVHVYGADGALASTCSLPDGLGDGTRVASSLGAFFLDASSRPSVVTDTCTVTRLSDDAAPWTDAAAPWTLAGADEQWLYVAAAVAPAPGFTATYQLQALDPATLAVVGRMPTAGPARVVPGDRVAVLDTVLIRADRPAR